MTIVPPDDRDNHDPDEGERLKRQALQRLRLRRRSYVRAGQRAMLHHALQNGLVSIDDVRPHVPLPPDISPKLFGAVSAGLAEEGLLQPAGYIRTARKEAHARPVMSWTLTDAAAGRLWLQMHPELPAPDDTPLFPED